MAESMQVDSGGMHRNSIGTLTGWQLLANQVSGAASDDADTYSSAGNQKAKQNDQAAAGKPAGRRVQLRTSSSSSSMSDDSAIGPAQAASVTPRPHQWLYKEYKLQDEIGSGGFGRVCRARRLTDGKVVVVKEIKTTSLSQKQKAATMDEVEVLAKFNHPNIVKYHDCFMDDVYINIVMEYCNAGDLAGLIKQKARRHMPEAEVMSLFVQICLALVYVHSAGVLHRDLKGSNVLITSSPNFNGMPLLKLGDFGVAKISGPESSMASTIVGTPQYLSPEMCDNKPYGKKSDVWALGCILYELCSLQKAFDLGNGGISGIILKIMRGTYQPIPAAYSDDMKALVASMLQTDPAVRPSVMEILDRPYVRQHLGLYLEWARNVPEAHPEILLASLGEPFKRGATGLGKLSSRDSSSSSPRADSSPPSPHAVAAALVPPASSSAAQPAGGILTQQAYAAAAANAGLGRGKQGSSSSTVSIAESQAAPAGAAAEQKVQQTAANSGRTTSAELPFMNRQVQKQQHMRRSMDGGSVAAAKAADTSGRNLSSWLHGNSSVAFRQQQPQQVVAAAVAASRHSSSSGGSLPPAVPPQQQQPLHLQHSGSNGSCATGLYSPAGSQQVHHSVLSQHGSSSSSGKFSTGLAQEQLEGLRRLRSLKARMTVQVVRAESACGSSVQLHTPNRVQDSNGLATLMSIDSISHLSAML